MSKTTSVQSPFRVLFVCTGNICRSPLAEQVFRQLFEVAQRSGLATFESAGVYAEVGKNIHPDSAKSMTELGFTPEQHVARQLTAEQLENADLVLSATTDHRAEVARTLVKANRYSFTLPEFARIATYLASEPEAIAETMADYLAENPVTDFKSKVAQAAAFRGYAPPATTTDDILDPWGRGYGDYQAVAKEIQNYANTITDWLGAK